MEDITLKRGCAYFDTPSLKVSKEFLEDVLKELEMLLF